ncbi:MAG TPA: hypothetical protein VN368_01160 [Candidatus Methylomirabilis sp.]|nr:hypothetical protein [Candidatus Methylomirabilis sp.]
MAVPIIAGATGKTTETAATAGMQTANMGMQVAVSGASSGGGASSSSGSSISGTPLGNSLGKALDDLINKGGAGINGSPLGGLQSGTNKGPTGNTGNTGSVKKSPSLYEKMKEHGPQIKSAINKTKMANGMRRDVHGFGKDMMGQDAHRNDPERSEPKIHNRNRRL